jgi:hypothetical protein
MRGAFLFFPPRPKPLSPLNTAPRLPHLLQIRRLRTRQTHRPSSKPTATIPRLLKSGQRTPISALRLLAASGPQPRHHHLRQRLAHEPRPDRHEHRGNRHHRLRRQRQHRPHLHLDANRHRRSSFNRPQRRRLINHHRHLLNVHIAVAPPVFLARLASSMSPDLNQVQ